MIKFYKFTIELSAMDAMCLVEFLNLVGKSYDVGDELITCFSRFISAVDDSAYKVLPKDFFLSSEVYDILGSNGTGKRYK